MISRIASRKTVKPHMTTTSALLKVALLWWTSLIGMWSITSTIVSRTNSFTKTSFDTSQWQLLSSKTWSIVGSTLTTEYDRSSMTAITKATTKVMSRRTIRAGQKERSRQHHRSHEQVKEGQQEQVLWCITVGAVLIPPVPQGLSRRVSATKNHGLVLTLKDKAKNKD